MIDKSILNKLVEEFLSMSLAATESRPEQIAYRNSAVFLRKAIDSLPDWSKLVPSQSGAYVVIDPTRAVPYVVTVSKGQWQKRQNPEWLYVDFPTTCNSMPLNEVPAGFFWFGPLVLPK